MRGSESECREPTENSYFSDFAILLDHSRDIILFLNYDTGRIIRASNAAVSAYGYSPAELCALTIYDLRPEADHFAIDSQMKNAFEHGARFETFHHRKDGGIFPVEVSSRGATIGGERLLISIVRDITERRKLEEALRQSEEKFSKAFNHSPVPITITDAQTGRYLSVNRAYCEHTGYSEEELIGSSFHDLGIVDAKAQADISRRLKAGGKVSNCESQFRTKSGDLRTRLLSAAVMHLQGNPAIITSGLDITDRKQMESALRDSDERFRLFMDNSPTLAWMKDEEGRYVYISGSAEKYYGVQSRDALGKTDVELFGPEAAEQFTRNDRAVLAAGRPLDVTEEVIAADGKSRYWLNSKFPFKNSSGSRCVAGIGMEVTERKQAESNQALQTSILQVLNRGGDLHQMIAETLKLIQAAGFDAVGLRLSQGEEWPYFESRGFSQDFLCTENNLCRRGEDGLVVHDVEGRPLLDCTCGLILADKADPSLPYFTQGGSFWSNAASELLALAPEADPRQRPRNRCIHEGFESVGLFPLRSGDQIIGLLQLNDKRGGCFTPEKIIFYENLAQNIGLALQRASAEQALHENEQRLAAILEQLPVGVGLVDRNGHLTLSNSTLQKLIESHLLPSKDPGQAHRWHFLDAQGHPIAPEQWPGARALRGEIVSPGMEAFYAGDTSQKWVLVSAVPFRSADADILGAILVAQDISARKQGQLELLALTATLERRVAERTELAECRAKQLQALAVELIEAEERERQRISYLLHEDLQQILAAARLRTQQTHEQASHLTALGEVSQMLSDAIIKSRQLSHELSPAILQHSRLTEALAWLSQRMGQQFGIHIELKADTHLELDLEPLKIFIFRAVQELLFNVVKHAGVKEALVSLSSNGDQFIAIVADSGHGFLPSNLDKSSANRGIGLLSLRERTNYIGGSLTIESAPGRGSRIKLTIPIKLSCPDAPLPESVNPKCVPANDGMIRVLLADDHKVMRQGLIKLIAGQPGLSIVGEAANGREAVELARKLQPHVVIMDVSMPEMDGIEASRRLKAELPKVRIIGLSMFEDEQTARRMYAAGAEAFVAKTASSAELLKAIYGTA